MPTHRMRAWQVALALLFFALLAVVKTYPLILQLGSHVCCDALDPTMLAWVLAWDVHALTTGKALELFDANIFHPFKRSLAFSEHLLGVVPLFAPGYLLTGNPIVGYNHVLLLSFVLSALSMLALAYYWTRQAWPSLVAGTLFGFAAFRFGQLSHLQLQNFFWAPIAFLFLDRFVRGRRWRDLAGLAVAFWLQVLSSIYLGYMLAVGLALYAAYCACVVDRSLLSRSVAVKALAFAAASAALLVPIHYPYLEARRAWGFARGVEELVHYSPDLLHFLAAPPFMNSLYRSWLPALPAPAFWEKWLFPGLVLPALVVAGSFGRIDGLPAETTRRLRALFWLVLGAALLTSLGPYLIAFGTRTDVPLPYLALYEAVPGFNSMRVPGRFVLLALLAASPLAALGVVRCAQAIRRRHPSWRFVPAATSAVAIGLYLLELGWNPLPVVPVPGDEDSRQLYRWLAAERPGPVVELPFGFEADYRYVFFTTMHWSPIVNGLSSFAPEAYDEIQAVLSTLPSATAVQYAAALGVKTVVVHTNQLSPGEAIRWNDEAVAAGGLAKQASFGPSVVYAVPPVSLAPSLRAESSVPAWLPVGPRVSIGLRVRVEDDRPWRSPGPHGWLPGLIEWTNVATGHRIASTARFQLPTVVLPGAAVDVPTRGSVPVPDAPGTYRVRLSIPAAGVVAASREVEIRNVPLHTSRDAPRLLAASYSVDARGTPLTAASAQPIRIGIEVANTGGAIWLANAERDEGAVRLAWRWMRDGRELSGLGGRAPLPHDVFPGQRVRFVQSIATPATSGSYVLELGLVSELVTAFADVGSAPVRLPIRVESHGAVGAASLAPAPPPSSLSAPRVSVTLDADVRGTGEFAELLMQVANASRPWTVDAYLVLEHARGPRWFYDGHALISYESGPWPPLARNVVVSAHAKPGGTVRVPLPDLPAGRYRWRAVLTDAGTQRVIAEAETGMELVGAAEPGR